VVLSLYSRGMTTRDIEAHLEQIFGAKVSRDLIFNISEVDVDEIKPWPSPEAWCMSSLDRVTLRGAV
jgi:putative transposase